MKTKLIVIVILAAVAAHAHADAAWHVAASGLPDVDVLADVVAGHYWVSPDDIKDTGLDLSKLATVNGKIDMAEIGAVTADELNGALKIATRPALLPQTQIDMLARGVFMAPEKPKGTFLNYDIRTNQTFGVGASAMQTTGLFEYNTFFNGIRANYQAVARTSGTESTPAFERMAAALSHENADTATTWTLGDNNSYAGNGVAPVRFTGYQYRKDFSLTPGFVTSPTYSVAGVAAAPSTLQVLMGNQTIRTQQIPAGPFSITNLQPLLGANGAQIIVQDIFGQQQIINSQIVGGTALLKAGLSDYSYQVGQIRPTLERSESTFMSGYYSKGITNAFTVEGNAEASQAGSTLSSVRHAGVNATYATQYGNFSAGSRIGTGTSSSVSYQNAWHVNDWNLTLRSNIGKASPGYLQMGGGMVPALSESVQVIVQKNHVSFSALISHISGYHLVNAGLTFSPKKPDGITWSAMATTTISGTTKSATAMVFASIPFNDAQYGRSSYLSDGVTQTDNLITATQSYSNHPSSTFGASYSGQTQESSQSKRLDASVDYRAFYADIGIAVSTINQAQDNQTGLRAYARGAVVFDGDYVGTTRWIDSSYAVVDAGVPGAVVLMNNTPSAKTDTKGFAVISGFQPFIQTYVQLDGETLPDNWDVTAKSISTYRKAESKIVFANTAKPQAMVLVPGFTAGVLTVNGERYPVTDRGVFVELAAGSYTGTIDTKTISFTIYKQTEVPLINSLPMVA